MGRWEPRTGMEPCGRLVRPLLDQEPYRSAQRVFWVADNGPSPRGPAAGRRLLEASPNAMWARTSGHASWLHHGASSRALVQRPVLTPQDFASWADVAPRLRLSEEPGHPQPRPFQGLFTRAKRLRSL